MTRVLIGEFDGAAAILKAAQTLRAEGAPLVDALTPSPATALAECMGARESRMRIWMATAGVAAAAAVFALEWYGSVIGYPIDSGGRPLNSWPAFLEAPFEIGVLAAALAGFVSFLVGCGFPALHHPLFGYPGIERASQDRHFLLVARRDAAGDQATRRALFDAGAVSVGEGVA